MIGDGLIRVSSASSWTLHEIGALRILMADFSADAVAAGVISKKLDDVATANPCRGR